MSRPFYRKSYFSLLISIALSLLVGTPFYYRHKPEHPSTVRHGLYGVEGPDAPIPNIVHYIWIIDGRTTFRIDFRAFVSIYSSHYYFKPDAIYIHTDATEQQWMEALENADQFTQAAMKLPSIVHNHIDVPTHSNKGVEIQDIRHRSDFIRADVLVQYGGIYMDSDVVPIRDIRPLRESGFANIVGNQDEWRINNGILMCRKGSIMMSIFNEAQHEAFDGGWTKHSVELLSHLAYRMHAVALEVLIVGKYVFSPSSWTPDEIVKLFGVHPETTAGLPAMIIPPPTSFMEAVGYWDTHNNKLGKEDWEFDYSGSYLIHAFSGTIEAYKPTDIDLQYVLNRQSNLARAAYPAIRHAVSSGIIKDI